MGTQTMRNTKRRRLLRPCVCVQAATLCIWYLMPESQTGTARLIADINWRLPGWSDRNETEPLDPNLLAQKGDGVLLLWYTTYAGHQPRNLLGWEGTYHSHEECFDEGPPCLVTDDRRA